MSAPSGAEQARLWELLREEAGALARDAPPPPRPPPAGAAAPAAKE